MIFQVGSLPFLVGFIVTLTIGVIWLLILYFRWYVRKYNLPLLNNLQPLIGGKFSIGKSLNNLKLQGEYNGRAVIGYVDEPRYANKVIIIKVKPLKSSIPDNLTWLNEHEIEKGITWCHGWVAFYDSDTLKEPSKSVDYFEKRLIVLEQVCLRIEKDEIKVEWLKNKSGYFSKKELLWVILKYNIFIVLAVIFTITCSVNRIHNTSEMIDFMRYSLPIIVGLAILVNGVIIGSMLLAKRFTNKK